MLNFTHDEFRKLWTELLEDGNRQEILNGRLYNRLDLSHEKGFRVAIRFPDAVCEVLIELSSRDYFESYEFPKWQGMEFEIIELSIPSEKSTHLSLSLNDPTFMDVFTTLCAELAIQLDEQKNETRESTLITFLYRWTKFFERHANNRLSPERERGLFGELYWMRQLLDSGLQPWVVLGSWEGYKRSFHDYDLNGHVVEVKTTMTKEPRKVKISNERQLDSIGIGSLHLMVFTLMKSSDDGETLPELVSSLYQKLSDTPELNRILESKLITSGYLDVHKDKYSDKFKIKIQELFEITSDFPRITELPNGIGDISYSLTLSAANDYLVNKEDYLASLLVHTNGT